jgi:hypothetical protein
MTEVTDILKGCGVGLVIAVALIGLGLCLNEGASHQQAMNNWAASNQYKIVSTEQPLLNNGPYGWFVDEDDTIYKVTVRDKLERTRTAWFRFGDWGTHEVRME